MQKRITVAELKDVITKHNIKLCIGSFSIMQSRDGSYSCCPISALALAAGVAEPSTNTWDIANWARKTYGEKYFDTFWPAFDGTDDVVFKSHGDKISAEALEDGRACRVLLSC